MRDAYAVQYPLWGKYYHPQEAGTGGGTSGGGSAGGGGGGRSIRAAGRGAPALSIPPSLRAGLRGGFTGEELMKKGLGTGGVTSRPVWPRWLLDKLGKAAIAELNTKAAADIAIVDWPERLKKYLKNLDAQEPGVEAKTQEIYMQIKRGGGGGGPVLKM